MSEEFVLELDHIRKEYPGVVALSDVTLQLKPGEILGLGGENGAGIRPASRRRFTGA